MATTTHLPLEQYLATSYHPDCDYIDGEIEERNLGEREHARLQTALILWLGPRVKAWNLEVLAEQRVRVSPQRVRIPEICLVSLDAPYEKVISTPPLVVVEILSPEDRVARYNERLEDYRRMGVANIWVADPEERRGFDWNAGWEERTRFDVANSPVYLDLAEVFATLPQ
ncbi:MAG TPA: Uma2 family endonuclease [Acidobacteriaceae bacterium]|jgi:Uma2 family endonuclease